MLQRQSTKQQKDGPVGRSRPLHPAKRPIHATASRLHHQHIQLASMFRVNDGGIKRQTGLGYGDGLVIFMDAEWPRRWSHGACRNLILNAASKCLHLLALLLLGRLASHSLRLYIQIAHFLQNWRENINQPDCKQHPTFLPCHALLVVPA